MDADVPGVAALVAGNTSLAPPVTQLPAIELKNVSKSFETGQSKVHALRSVDLSIPNKEFVCILGPSGCGKSTVLGMIAGLITPDSGSVNIDNGTVADARSARRIGLVFQDAVLLPWRTVAE